MGSNIGGAESDNGYLNLIYTWQTVGMPPAPVTFTQVGLPLTETGFVYPVGNSLSCDYETTATFTKAGNYSFRVTVTDPQGDSITSSNVNVTVNQTLTSIVVTPTSVNVADGGRQQFSAIALDQFGNPLATQPTFTWTSTGPGSINSSGLYSAPSSGTGSATVKAKSGSGSGTATVTVTSQVTNNLDSGPGSLRQALLDAANVPGQMHTIQFELPSGQQSISLLSPLPSVADPLILSLDVTQNVTVVLASPSAWNNASTLTITGGGKLSFGGGIEGIGNLAVNAGSNLTASHIRQNALTIGGTAGSPAMVTLAASDANGNPLNSVAASNLSAATEVMAGLPPTAATTSVGASAIAAASMLTSTTASSEPSSSVAVAPSSGNSAGSALAIKSNSSDSAGLIALQSTSETGGVSALTYSVSDESERSSSLTTTGVSLTSDAATFLERQTAIVANGNDELLHSDAVAAAFTDANVLEWAASTPAFRLSAADADISRLADDLLDAIGRQWRN